MGRRREVPGVSRSDALGPRERARRHLDPTPASSSGAYYCMAALIKPRTRCVEPRDSHRSWPMVVFEWTSFPSTTTSKLPVTPRSWISFTETLPPNSDSIALRSALEYFPYPHPPQY
mmetsp:Transcript_1745/g.5316  ORF Transcript_1745/g.5316 Transcript_1745/m.5316 type:complete len:117 (+) Transcript_1745:590-940(+)